MRRLRLLFGVLALALSVGARQSVAAPSGAYVVVDIVGFAGPNCSAALIDISNRGNDEQPFGWTLTLDIPKLGISQTFVGQQPLAPGASQQSIIGTGITEDGTYLVKISPGNVSGRSKSGHAILRIPEAC